MDFDVIIIGAGMSGLAAGIRLALFDQRVCIVEKHYAYGGLNSYYTLGGRRFDVGLHALTNYVPAERRTGPLPKVLRQLRLTREELELCPQRYSEIQFPGRRLRFGNDPALLLEEVSREFPKDADAFARFFAHLQALEFGAVAPDTQMARAVLRQAFADALLGEMLLCPVMYYGCGREEDMDFADFSIIFKSLFCEGFARPRDGILGLLKPLVRKFRGHGGKLRMQAGVHQINVRDNRAEGVTLESGETLTCGTVLSSAGLFETARLCGDRWPQEGSAAVGGQAGRVTFVESLVVLDRPPAQLGNESTILFFNDAEALTYACPETAVDERSGVFCCTNNYANHEHLTEGLVRLTWLANYDRWAGLTSEPYAEQKRAYQAIALERIARHLPEVRDHVVFADMFTPRTIEAFTGHVNGTVYGSPQKRRDGRTPIDQLFLCGTDQGLVGVVGALMSGLTMANVHVLGKT